MIDLQGFAYAQARLQARFAQLPPEDEWQRLGASRTLAAFLEDGRTGVLRDWIKGFSGQSDTHDLEAGLRVLYRETVDEVSTWVPRPWREAVAWPRWLILLPLLDRSGVDGQIPGWVSRDPWLNRLLGDDGSLDSALVANAGAGGLLDGDDDPLASWAAEWRGLWPRCGRESLRNMDALTRLLRGHAEGFPRLATDSAWGARKGLRERLRLLFHQRMLQPAAPFIYLALAALDLERLRAALVTRVLFVGTEAA